MVTNVPSSVHFRLSPIFIEQYQTKTPPFGFDGLGELVYLRTYSRLKDDGTNENWWETVERVVAGVYSMQKNWITSKHLGWDEAKAQESAQEMYDRIFTMKFLPPGRGLWAMGSPLTEELGLWAALNSCAFVSTANLATDLAEPFTFLMEASMLGIGVGFDTKGAYSIVIQAPTEPPVRYEIPDTREGWVQSVGRLLRSYFTAGNRVEFDYSLIRKAGEPIKGFGGVAAGPEPLQELHEHIRTIFNKQLGEPISITNIVDVQNLIGKCVVAGNVRRCLPVGTLIHTDEGLIPIEEIVPGMKAKTATGYTPISKLISQGSQSVWAVITQLGEFRATAKHKLAVMTGIDEYEWRQLQDLQAGDRLVFVQERTKGITTALPSWSYDYPKHSTTCQALKIPELDSNMGWFIGLVHGDGYAYANRKHKGFNAYVDVACATDYPNIIDDAAKELSRFVSNVVVTSKKNEKCVVVRAQSKQLAWYFDDNIKQPKTPLVVPSWIRQASHEVRAAYVAGVFDADGSQGRPLILASSIYPTFLRELQAVSASLGIPTRLGLHRKARDTWQALWQLKVVGESALAQWDKFVAPHARKYEQATGRRRSGHDYGYPAEWVIDSKINYGGAWSAQCAQMTTATAARCGVSSPLCPVTVTAIVPNVATVDTYDITVPGANEFVVQEGLLVHNSAEIVLGDADSEEYLNLKNYKENPERAAHGWASNNSVFAETGMDYTRLAERIRDNGEPGLVWLKNMQNYGHMGSVPDYEDQRVAGTNPCGEQQLESFETCCLVETFPALADDLEDYKRTLKFAYLYAKTVTLGNTPWWQTNRVMGRNRRIGCSQSGIVQTIAKLGIDEYKRWCEEGYKTIQHYDEIYSAWFIIPKSIRTTSIKPSGTVSLLAGATPGLHFPESRTYIRRMRLSRYSELLAPLKSAGYTIEPCVGSEESTVVVEFPVRIDDNVRIASEVSLWEQLSLAAFIQRHWADNAVSCTITFDPETEGSQIAHALDYFQYQLKGVSFLPRLPHGAYPQMPYEAISEERYWEMSNKLAPIDFGQIAHEEADVERFCSNDTCEVAPPVTTEVPT